MSMLYLDISLATCAAFPVAYIVLTFQFPKFKIDFGLTIGVVSSWASSRLSPRHVIDPEEGSTVSPSRAQNHNAKEIQAEDQDDELQHLINAQRQRINFPVATAVEQWEDLDSKIVLKLDSLIGDSTLEHELITFGDIVYQTSLETFGPKQYQSKCPPRKSKRQREIDTLHKQMRNS
ncbi:reverse transcriptase [Elysia marginata]|uniref:Reverse transcriptase n=1 Tax=Elysia marginata TaxID=1093978 RepID=A0AAV4JPU5_9GAST|nr:reverse transcriptase [Elysia marginata]